MITGNNENVRGADIRDYRVNIFNSNNSVKLLSSPARPFYVKEEKLVGIIVAPLRAFIIPR